MTGRPLACLALCLMLAACSGGGASVSGSASEGAAPAPACRACGTRAKSLGIETGKTYEMPAIGLMADAFLADNDSRGLSLDVGPNLILAPREGGRPQMDVVVDSLIAPTRKGYDETPPTLRAKESLLDADHRVYSVPIVIAMQPRKGWEVDAIDDRHVDPEFDTPFFRAHRPPSRYDEDLHVRYMEMLAISAIYTDTVFGMIDKALGTSRLSDPDAAKRQVLIAFQSIPAASLKAATQDAARQVIGGSFTTDLTGSGNIHFRHDRAGDFVADPRGLTWTKAGGVWFGDGHIDGQTVNLRLASTASLSQRQAQSGTQGTNTDAKVEGSGSVGPGH